MKKTFTKNFAASCLMIVVLLQQSVTFVYADDGFVGSPAYNDGFVGSPAYNDGFVGSPVYNDGYVGSPVYNDGFVGSPTYNDGFVGSPVYNDGYVGSTVINNDGFVGSPALTTTSVSPVYNDGYVGTTVSSYVSPVVYSQSSPVVYGSTGYTYPSTYGYTSSVGYPSVVGNYGYISGGSTGTSCPAGTTLVNGTCVRNVICNSEQTLINGICVNNVCPAGTTGIVPNCTAITTVNNYTCWNGTIVAYASLCPINYTTNYTQPTTYYNYQPAVTRYPVITQAPIVKFNNVVTSVVTQITNTSGRCNGIGLIANGAPSTGWFEYGETSSLGRTTASAQIGRSSSAPFSNVLANLKPSTKYYCRAVMQNQYGVVKGEIVSFVTKGTSVTYVKPVVAVKKVVTKKVVVAKKPEVVCLDWGYKTETKGASVTSISTQSEKLMTLNVEKLEGKLIANSSVSYRVAYKNLTDSRLTGVLLKVTIPSEIKLLQASTGNYDENSRTLILNQDTVDAYGEGTVIISGLVAKDAPVGKSIVTTAYVVYTVPSTQVQDEVTAYVVGSILPTENFSNADTGAKKVIGTGERGFMPNNLVEWLALIAILFIIFILARSIYVSFKEDEEGGHGH